MSPLALHLLCATIAAARAIDNAQRVGYALESEGSCGEWKSEWRSVPLTSYVYVSGEISVTEPPATYPGVWSDLDEPLAALTGDRGAKLGQADWSASSHLDDGNVLGAIGAIESRYRVKLPEGFDWKTWEPQGVPA